MKRIFAVLLVLLALFNVESSLAADADTFIVTREYESDIRSAIEKANARPEGPNVILFNFRSTLHTIKLSEPLVLTASNTIIDGKDLGRALTAVLDGVDSTFAGIQIDKGVSNVVLKNLTVKNCSDGVFSDANGTFLDNCTLENNINGVTSYGRIVIDNCKITNNKSDGVLFHHPMGVDSKSDTLFVKNSVIASNGFGISVSVPTAKGSIIENNLIYSNREYGVYLHEGDNYLYKNYIGTNRSFADLGNGNDGVYVQSNASVTLGHESSIDSANFIGFNKGNGIHSEVRLNVYKNYIGVTNLREIKEEIDGVIVNRTRHTAMPNGKNGIESEIGTIKGNYIGYNKQNGIVLQRGIVEGNYIGGIIGLGPKYRFGNENYGLYIANVYYATDVIKNHFVDNTKGGIYTADPNYSPGYNDDEIRVTNNLFGGDQDRTIYGTVVNSPIIDTIHYDDDYYKAEYILVKGTVKFSTLPSGVTPDKEKVGIELYLSLGVNSAYKYVGYTESDKDGNWVYKIPKNMVDPNRYFTATAIHYGLVPTAGNRQVSVNYTSALSAPKWFGYKPTSLKYYVKENCTGDGSSWDKAMGPDEFATYLPIVPSGSVFYVAQGMYHPIYNSWGEKDGSSFYKINNDVTIHGGFSKEAKSGAIADPSVYKTIFSGDILKNDKIVESVDEDGELIIERPDDIYKDNSGTMFYIKEGDYTVNIEGVCIEGATMYGLFASGEDTKLNVNSCEFTNNGDCIFFNYPNNKVSVSNSIFKYNTGYVIESLNGNVDVKKCEFSKNIRRILFAANEAEISLDSISVHDNSAEIECVGNSKLSISNSEFYDNIYPELIMTYDTSKVTLISKTNFKNNICRSYVIRHHGKKMILDSCLIDNNKASYCVYGTNDFYIYNSSITNNESKSELLYNASGNEFVLKNSLVGNNVTDSYLIGNWGVPSSIINSTIVDNKCSSVVSATSDASYYNNTIVANECSSSVLYDCSTSELVGNILTGNIHGSDALTFYGKDTSAYNIIYPVHRAGYGYDSIKGLDNYFIDDLDKEKALLSYLFDVDGSDKLLIKDNGGFTPTIALKSDVLADDTPIRFPRLENVLTDQRGESRDDMTCMGAYELIEIDTVIVRDTIVLGKTYVFNDKNMTPEKIGIYRDTMLVKKGNKEVVQVLKLYVKPDGSRNYFYVKKVAEGNGTGSSWNNAMSGEDFAFVLPLVGMGVKFYIAEGVYNPIYDAYGDESDDPTSLCYRIKNNVTIYGGYPADAKIGATADPENHPTVFSGDHKGDDKVVKGVDENGRLKLTYSNRSDNSIKLFEANKCDVTFNNVIVDGAASYGINSNGDITRFYGNNVTFQNCDYAVYYTSDKAVIFIDKSKFENISSGCLYTPNGWNTNVTSTVFSGNTGYLAYSASEGMISFDSVTVTGNNAKIYSVNNVELKISNSEFIDNDNSGSLIYVVNKDRETKITKSLFKENKKLILDFDANSSLIIDSCSFIGNTEKLLDIVGSSNTTIGNSIFEKNILPIVDQENEKRENLVSSYGYVDIKSSSFFDNKCGSLVYVTSLDAENNTFVKNDVSSVIYQIYSGDIFRLSNNTIISNRASDYPLYANSSAKAYFYGNVILDNTQDLTQTYRNQYIPGELSEFYNIKEAKFNLMDIIRKNPQTELYDNSTYIPDNNSNIWVKPREITMQEDYDNCGACEYATDKSEEYYLTNLFEGALDSETGRFYPSIKDNGGYTPTVALKSNVLPDGTSITFPRLENVLADQRGELRDDMTCMGAYETTGNDTVFVRDTIVLGKTYVFNEKEITPEKIGVYHDTMVVKKGNKEVAQVLKLYVRPDWLFNCYVKKVAEGTGDGSSWENAMSAEDFAFALPFAAVGAEFYVAEGIYNPIYDLSGNETDDSTSLCYRIQNNALIYGGYPADAKTGATPDPENHPTIFSGDHKRDDKVVKGVDENGRLTITYSNREDNSKQLFVSKASVVRLYNVDIEGATSYGISNVRNGNANFEADNSNFRNCDYAVYYPNKDAVVFINKSKFENISSGCLFTPNGWNTNVTSTVFSGNTGYIAYSASEGMMSFDSVTVTGNNAQIYSVNNVELKISNSEFINNDNSGSLIYMVNADRETTSITKSLFKDNKNQIFEFYANTSLDIDSCSFIGNSNRILYAVGGSKTSIGRCVFEKNILPTIDDKKSDLVFSYGNVDVKSSSYFDNECGNLVSVTSVDVENSTFVKNDVSSIIYQSNSGDIFRLSNNTIISNRASNYPLHSNSSAEAYLYGNVILDNKLDEEKSATGFVSGELSEFYNIQEVKYNLMDIIRKNPQTETYDMSTYIPDNNTNIFVKPREITTDENYTGCKACEYATDNSEEYYLTNLFEGSLDSETGTFTPTIKNNGGFTPTVALKSDKLSDGTLIRFPRLENVLTDQRGVSRFDETCMGAYEMRCGSDTTFTTDTIYVGEKIYGQTFTKVGVHDSIFETLTSSLDCDSVVMHKVVVKPDPKTLNYYVKTKKVGDGDGRDWDNAMNGTDFATYLPLAPDGATFYVAAGTYKPVYDANLNTSSNTSGLCYAINSSVTIRGGYPADATGTDVPSDPKKYETIFDGDIKGDDVINETSGEDGYVTVKAKNRENNSSYMFFSNSQKGLHVGFDGVYVKNASEAIYILYSDKYVSVSNSKFVLNDNAVFMPYEGENLEVYNTSFSKHLGYVVNMPNASNLTMDSILFENNQRNLVYIPGTSGVNPNHNVRLNRIYAYANGDSSAIVYSIGHDFVLSNSEFKNNRGLLYLYDNTRIDSTIFENNFGDLTKYGVLGFEINECKFIDNRCKGQFINSVKNGTELNHFSVTNSIFKNTDSNGLMYVVTDSVNISKSEISGSTNSDIEFDNYRNAILSNCYIHDNEHLHMLYNGYGMKSSTFTYLKGNTIANNISYAENGILDRLIDFSSDADSVVFTNNTFVSNTDGTLINFSGCRPYMYNNTIVGNLNNSYVIDAYPGDLVLRGNIILGNSSEIVRSRWSTIDYKDNILPRIIDRGDVSLNSIGQEILDGNIFSIFDLSSDNSNIHEELKDIPNRNEEILTYLFEGKYNSETGLFTPVLANNGGITPTVALKKDVLADGTSIRFPRLENVLTDQRGVERFDSTCMGAYEMRCNAVDTVLKDTVMVGDSYTFIDKNLDDVCQKVGSYHFTETLKTVEGCDSIVKLSLAVRPQKNENGYYVKEDGTGDGSDWNNAMSPKDFAEYLPLVYDGETFHIAAGTYKSTYVDPELGRMYNINSSVTLIGGYPDTVTSTSTPSMPDVYVTKLTADVNGNDYTYYYPNSLEYTPYSNVKDNDSILIRVNGEKTLNLFGMTLSGVKSCDRGAVDLADGASLVMDRCFVQDNVASGVYGKGVDVKVTNSVFTHNYSNNGAAFNLVDSKLNVQSTAVYENRAKVEECKSEYAMGGVANLENTEATFENSTLSNNAADMGSVFSVKSSKLDLTNNTIVGNQIIPESKHKGSFIGSLDDKSSVSLFGNIVIGNQNGEFDGVVNVASSDYNVFSYKTDMSYGSHDMVMNDPKEVQMLLDGDFAFESETVFIPNIQYNGGYTPTVAVIQSAFDGGKILNIPLDDRKVTYDQRGFVRKDSSCIGAFEFPTFMGYYVKKQAHGDGSGRDWENSMNDTTFAKYFSVVPTNASFYVAEGVYSPMFDSYGKLSTNKSRRYSSSRLVNIYGGYPDSAQTGCVADPVKYKTVLSVDYNGDDKYVVSDNDFTSIDVLNSQDNGYSIVNITSKFPGWVEINGVEFRGQSCVPRASSSAVQILGYNVSGVNTRIEKCSFVGNYAAIYSGCDTTIIEECLFDSLDYCGLSVSSFSLSENNYLLVDKTTFANSLYQLSASSFRGLMRVQNSTFANALYGVTTPLDFMSTPENTKIEIYNNSFFSGKKEDCSLLVYDYIPVELKGNIISSKKLIVKPDQNGKYESKPIVSDYNVYTTEIDAYPLGENDTIVPQSSIGEIVKGVVENDIFEASLEDEGLYVKKLPTLINVKFEKGGGIKKMPKNATPVTDDQIGEIRSKVDYCVGAIEADCEFKKANFKLELAEEEICRDDTAKVTLTGLTKKEKATYKFAWTSSKDSVYVVDTFGNPGSFHVYARQALVPLQMTITNVCGVDTVLEIMQKVNGVGSVPFDGIEEGEVFCQNESEPVKLTTAVEGAIFTGECVVKKTDGYYFDASKAKGDSTRVRCSIQDGDCRSFDEKTIHFFKFDGDEAVEILASTQTKNVCMEKPQAQSVFTVTGWRDGLTCRLNGLASTLMDSTVTKDSVLTVTYGSLKNGEYIFVVSDECKPIASETIKIENEEIDPDMLKLSLDTVVANTQTCDGGEFGDVRVEYSGNINKADVVVVLSSLGTMVKSDTLSEEEAFVVFDNLKPAVYDVKIFFEGMEDCTIGDANYSRTVDVTKPVKFEVAFTATQAICENSIDAMMFTKTSGGNTPYTYKWTKYVGDIATSTVSHTKALHDTLPDLVKNEVYLCDVVDNYGCAASSDTLKIIYDHADSTLVDTFIYDPYQRCKGINNAQMIVDFDVVSEYAHPVYSLKEWNDKEYSEIDKNDADPALNKILLGALAPGKYKLHVGYPSVGCPALIDTTVEIKELVNDFKFEPADSIRMPRCYADNDAAIYFHAIGASRGLTATFSYKSNGKTLYKLSIDSLAGDTAYFVADNLPNDSFVVKMKNVCGEEITYEYNVGAPGFGIEMIDSISFKMLKCRYDSTGIIAFHINTGDYDSTKVTLRYSKPEEVIYVYDDTTYTTVDVPVYKIEPRVKDTIWNADSTDFDVRYERDPETNEIIIDTFVTYEKKDTMIIKKKNKPGIRYVEAVFPCKFDTVYGKDTTFIYSGLPGGGYFIDLVSTIKGCKDSVRIKDTIKIPNPVILSHEVLDISCKSKTDGVISLKPIRSGGRDRTFVLKHDSTFKDGKYEYEMCYIGYLIDGPSTVNGIGQEVKKKEFVNYEYDGCPLMTSLNRISNEAHLYKKDGDSYTQIQRYDIINPEKNLKRFLFGEEWKSIKWTKQDATGNYIDFTIVTPDSTTYEEDVYYSGPDTIKTAVWSYTHLPNFWKDEYGEWLESGVQTIANLSKGVYQCVVTDSNDCVYSTKISVVEPKDPLRIEEVTYDAEGALCDPTKRHIDMKVKGGWGDYNYMVMDGKNEGKGGLIDNYLAATSITYDTLNAMGVYRSQFLDPGKYRVAVVDGKGCRIEFKDEIEVKTNFTVEGSVKDAVCPGEESADATFVIHDDAEKKYKYAVKEHIGSCDTPYDCVDDLNFVDCNVDFEDDGMTFTKKITGGGHGYFIYRLDEKGDTTCGTYVRVSAVDTLKPMTLSKKSISHVTCNGLSNGSIELYVLGGKAPYIVDVNPSWGSKDVDMSKPDLYPTVDPKDTLGKFPRIVIDNLKARDYYFTITDAQKCHQRFGDTATHTAKLTVKEPDALSAEFAASSMCANAGAANDPNYGSVSALDVKGGTSPYLFSVKGGLDTEREFDDGTTEIYHSSIESDEPFIPVAGYKETTFYYTISDANGCELSTSLMFGQDEVKVSRQTDFLATTWSHYGDIIALIDFCGPESTFDSVSYKFSNEKVKLLDKRLYIYDLENPKPGAVPNAKNIILSYYDTREVPDGFFIDNFNMAKDMTPLLASHINFAMVTDKSDLYKSTSHDANDSLYLKTDVIMSSYFKGCRYQVEINDFLKVAYDNVELYYGGVDRRKNILDIVVTPNPRTEGKPCTVNVYFANNTEDCVLTFYHMDGSEVDRVTIPAGQLKKTKYDYNDAYVYTYNVEDKRFNNVEVVVISAVTKYDSKGTILLNAGPAGE